jgi:hypothetical protein
MVICETQYLVIEVFYTAAFGLVAFVHWYFGFCLRPAFFDICFGQCCRSELKLWVFMPNNKGLDSLTQCMRGYASYFSSS